MALTGLARAAPAGRVNQRSLALGLAAAALTGLADQLSKGWMIAALSEPPRAIRLTEFFSLVPVENSGVSFGMLAHGGVAIYWLLSLGPLLVALGLAVWLARGLAPLMAVAVGLIMGGALGNAYDRLTRDTVFDFLYFHVGRYSFPAFNVADSAITVGVALILLDGLLPRRGDAR